MELTTKSSNVGTISSILMGSPMFVTSNTCVSYPKMKLGRKVILHYLEPKKVEKMWSFLLSLIVLEEHASDERSKQTHVHLDGKEN